MQTSSYTCLYLSRSVFTTTRSTAIISHGRCQCLLRYRFEFSRKFRNILKEYSSACRCCVWFVNSSLKSQRVVTNWQFVCFKFDFKSRAAHCYVTRRPLCDVSKLRTRNSVTSLQKCSSQRIALHDRRWRHDSTVTKTADYVMCDVQAGKIEKYVFKSGYFDTNKIPEIHKWLMLIIIRVEYAELRMCVR